jgi:hypothetical protein
LSWFAEIEVIPLGCDLKAHLSGYCSQEMIRKSQGGGAGQGGVESAPLLGAPVEHFSNLQVALGV